MSCLWLAARVRRCHTLPQTTDQTVADHSAGVALIIARWHPSPSVALLKAALFHDLVEYWTGDVPAPAKWANKDLSKALDELEAAIEVKYDIRLTLTPEEHHWLRGADTLELMFWCQYQVGLGNTYAIEVGERARAHLLSNPLLPPQLRELGERFTFRPGYQPVRLT